MFNRDVVTVGKSKHGYMNIDLNTLTCFLGDNFTLSDRKYIDCQKKSKTVYTVVGLVLNDYNDFKGYIVSNNKGVITLVREDKLVDLLRKYSCVNYSVYTNDGHTYFARKNPKSEVRYFKNSEIKSKLGYSFDDFELSFDMTLKELDFCMENNGFKLAYQRIFPVDYMDKEKSGYHLIYFNKEGIQIVFNYVSDIDRPLNYYHQTCLMIRDIDYKKYHRYIKENPYNGGSSSPLEDVNSNEELTHGKMLFTFTNLSRFLFIVQKVKTYSRSVNPYKLGSDGYGLHSILHINPYQDNAIRDYCQKNGLSDYKYFSFLKCYVGYLNLLKYDEGLKKFYANILNGLPKYFDLYSETFNISDKTMIGLKKFAENVA